MVATIREGRLESGKLGRGISLARKKSGRQKVDRVPDAVLDDQSISHCQNGHGNAACQAAFHSCRDRIDLEGKPCPVQIVRDPVDSGDRRAACGDRRRLLQHRYGFMFLVRQDVTKPADVSADGQYRAQNSSRLPS